MNSRRSALGGIHANITPSLHPDNLKAIEHYDDHTGPYINAAVEAFSVAYEGLAAVHTARAAADKNPTLNEAGKLLMVAQFAGKQQDQIGRKFDSAMLNLTKAIKATDEMLTTPLVQAGSSTISTEIRNHVKNLPNDKRYDFLKSAHEAGDVQTLSAVLGAPAFLSGLSQVEREAHTRLHHERTNPDAAKRLGVMRKAHAMLEERGGLVFKEVEKAIGASWSKVQRLKEARDESEKAFIVKDNL